MDSGERAHHEGRIRLERVFRAYAETAVLEDFSLTIEPGERLVILGPSGCGKTTLLRLIAGFEPPDRGAVWLGNERVAADGEILTPPERRHLGMVFQNLALWPHFSVAGNIEFGLKAMGLPRRERKARIAELLALVGLERFAERRPDELSGGQQQRVALARALATRPQVLLLDEPFSSLDPALAERLYREIVQLQVQLGLTLVHVTHNPAEADAIATRKITMAVTSG